MSDPAATTPRQRRGARSSASVANRADSSPLYRHLVSETRRALSVNEIASVTGAHARTVQNWAAGTSRPDGEYRDRLLELQYIIDNLSDVYEPEGVEIWLHAPQKRLGGRKAVDLLREGEFEIVLEAVEHVAGGPRR